VFAFLLAFGLTAVLVPAVKWLARVTNVYAHPADDRWHDNRPVPIFGGVAMAAALGVATWLAGSFPTLWPVVLASTLMFAVGLLDDVLPLRPLVKLGLQVAVAGLLIALLPPLRITGFVVPDILLGFAWIVGITNAINLLDNVDGLAAGVAAIAGAFLLVILGLDQNWSAGPLSIGMAALVGTTAAFLLFNFHPASIFMGDSGSHLLGSFLAGTTLLSVPIISADLVPVATIPVFLLLIPILDTAFVTLMRGLAGQSAFAGGRDHISHRLVALGIGERRAVLTLYALAILGGGAALGLRLLPPVVGWGVATAYLALLGVVGLYLGQISATRGAPATVPLPSEVTNRHRAYLVLLDILAMSAAYYLAFLIRFREPELSKFLPPFTVSLPLVVAVQIGALWLTGEYRRTWRWLGVTELVQVFRSCVVGVAASVIAVLYMHSFEGYSRSVFVFDAFIAPLFLIGVRTTLHGLDEYLSGRQSRGRASVIYGAGRGGALAARELRQNGELGLTPIGFIDDDPAKRRLQIDGLPVLGTLAELPALLARKVSRIGAVIVSIRDLPREQFDELCRVCEPLHIEVRRMRLTIDHVELQDRGATVVRFPR